MNVHFLRFTLALMLIGAGLARGQEVPADAAAAMAQAMAALGQAAEKNAAAGAVDAKELRALLPEKDAVAGFKRVKAGTESNTAMGFKVVVATAEFEAIDGDADFSVKYTDIGGLGALAKMAVTMQEVDEERRTVSDARPPMTASRPWKSSTARTSLARCRSTPATA